MATKTWKLGEMAHGGVITVETKGNLVTVIGKDWDVSAGTTKSSNQSKAKEFTRLEVNLEFNTRAESSIDDFLHDLTTAYYANEIMEWIKTKVKFFDRYCW